VLFHAVAKNMVHQIEVLAHHLALVQGMGPAQGQPTLGKMGEFNTRRNRLAGLSTASTPPNHVSGAALPPPWPPLTLRGG
jgi:hypothetical protein